MNNTEWLKRLLILCVGFVIVYIVLVINHVSINNLPKIYFTSSQRIDNLNVSLDNENLTSQTNRSNEEKSLKKCDIIHKDYKQYYVELDGVTYPQYLYRSQNYSINFDCLNNTSPMKLILAWTKFYGTENFGYGLGKVGPFKEHNCPVTNCELTRDKKRLNDSDFVIVWLTDSIEQDIPKYRLEKQRWIGGVIESPVHTPSFGQFNGVFNYTADYQVESEFGINYESQKRFLWGLNTTFNDSYDYSQGKTGFMTALISNCGAWHNNRMAYIANLKKYINMTVHGGCGQKCPPDVDCREFVGAKYKFYFAFENSNCKDYITEKFFVRIFYLLTYAVNIHLLRTCSWRKGYC